MELKSYQKVIADLARYLEAGGGAAKPEQKAYQVYGTKRMFWSAMAVCQIM